VNHHSPIMPIFAFLASLMSMLAVQFVLHQISAVTMSSYLCHVLLALVSSAQGLVAACSPTGRGGANTRRSLLACREGAGLNVLGA